MTEMDESREVAGTAPSPQDPVAGERAQVSRVLAGAVAVLTLMVPAAFFTGWRFGRTMGRLRGY